MSNKFFYYIFVACVLFAAILILLQLWTELLLGEIFIKLLVTVGIVALVCGLMIVAKADLQNNKKLRDENYLD